MVNRLEWSRFDEIWKKFVPIYVLFSESDEIFVVANRPRIMIGIPRDIKINIPTMPTTIGIQDISTFSWG